MTKITDMTAMTAAEVDAANDLVTVVDVSETAAARNKKMTFAELATAAGGAGALADLSDVNTTGAADGDVLTYDSGTSEWLPAAVAAGGDPEATDSEVWTGSSTTTRVSPRRVFTAAAPVSLTDGATITIDGNTGINFKVTLGGNRTLANPTNMKTGQSGIIVVAQDATGSRTLSYGTNWKFPGGAATGGVLSTAASSVDVISYFVRSDGTILASLQKAFS